MGITRNLITKILVVYNIIMIYSIVRRITCNFIVKLLKSETILFFHNPITINIITDKSAKKKKNRQLEEERVTM